MLRNESPFHNLKNHAIQEVARRMPTSVAEIRRLMGVSDRFPQPWGLAMLEAMETSRNQPPESLPVRTQSYSLSSHEIEDLEARTFLAQAVLVDIPPQTE